MHERIIYLYERHAQTWDKQRRGGHFIEEPWLECFIGWLAEGAAVLDVGCGNGEPIGRHLVEKGFAVTGLDSASSLIGIARRRFPAQEWIVGDMRELALERRFQGIIAWHSFFHLSPEDQRPMFARFAGHLEPGGVLMFTSGPEHGEVIGEWQGEPLYHGSLDPEEYRQLLATNGFALVDYRIRDRECGSATVWLARKSG